MFERGRVLVDRLLALRKAEAGNQAAQLKVLAEFAALDRETGDPLGEFTHREIAAVTKVSERYAAAWLAFAETLTTRLPATLTALEAGTIDQYKARRITQVTDILSGELAGRVEDEVLPQAEEWNPRQLNDRLRRAVARVDPAAAAARAAAAREARRVLHDATDDGAGLLSIQGDVERTQLAYLRIQAIAHQLKSTGDTRTVDQIAADVALDCLAGKDFKHAKVHVWLTLPATTALGVDDKPAHLAGYGWLPAQRALELAAQQDATWQRVLTDPATGQVLDVGRRRYRPPAALRDHLRASHPTCAGPGCIRPAAQCDQDHLVPFPAGPTSAANLRPLCRPHHRMKTFGGWRVEPAADGLGLVWITKHGYRVPYVPDPVADPEPSPPPDSETVPRPGSGR
jgi:hypothetical protein